MKTSWTTLAVLAILAAPAVAMARQPVPPRATHAVHELARCIFVAEPNRARLLLTMAPRDPRYAVTFQHVIERNACLAYGTISTNDRVFKGSLAEFVLLRDLAGAPLAAHVAYDPSRPPIRATDEGEIMSICVVRALPQQVETLLRTEPSSRGETVALQAIGPALPGCLRRGARAELDRSSLRAMLASAAFRLTEEDSGETADEAPSVTH